MEEAPMTDRTRPLSPALVTVFGGSGFLGRFIVGALTKRNYRVRVAVRRPNLAPHVMPFGVPGQIHMAQANLRYPDSVQRAVAGSDVVINLVGILRPTGDQSFGAVQAEGARHVAEAAAAVGARLIHMSALGADPTSESLYARSKAAGEAAALQARPDTVIVRPSVVFGPGDGFFTRFASLARFFPVLPLAGADTLFQPVYAGDVAEMVAAAVEGSVPGGRAYELGGPQVKSLRELVEYVLEVIDRRRLVLPLPEPIARAQAIVTEVADRATFGLVPDSLVLTRDQLALLAVDNVVSAAAKKEGRTLEGLGIAPTAYEAIVPGALVHFRPAGQFERRAHETLPSETPDQLAPTSGGPGSGFHPDRAVGPAAGPKARR
jgi:uncharacterized protein YbjT (DUF2867 family)